MQTASSSPVKHYKSNDRHRLEALGGHFFLCFFLCILVLDNPRTTAYNKDKERRCPTKRRRLLLLTGLAVLLFGAKQAREGNFLEFRSRRSRRREGCLMTTSEILLLFQTIIALLALLVSVVHLMDDRKKDDSYGSKSQSEICTYVNISFTES